MNSTWFITGSSSGFGRVLAEQLLDRGENVVMTARNPRSLADLVERFPEQALALALDVTNRVEIRDAVVGAEGRFGSVDVLVNNAGYGYRAAVEEGEDAEVRALFDTNVFGVFEVTKAILPGMRAQRRGTIVNMSSIVGRSGPAGSGYYASTKFAVEGISDALRKELAPLNIRVLVVEPGKFRTDFAGRSLHRSAVEIADYASVLQKRRTAPHLADEPGDPVKAAAAIIEAVRSADMPFRLLLGAEAVRQARAVLEEQRADLQRWEHVSVGADFLE